MSSSELTSPQPPIPSPDEDDDLYQDEDERVGFQLEASGPQKALWPFYIILLVVFLCALSVPLLFIYTMAWQAWNSH